MKIYKIYQIIRTGRSDWYCFQTESIDLARYELMRLRGINPDIDYELWYERCNRRGNTG